MSIYVPDLKKYLIKIRRSSLWKKMIDERIDEQCLLCESKLNLQVHHLNFKDESFYSRIAISYINNDLVELRQLIYSPTVTLCKKCHWNIHRGYNLCPVCNEKGVITFKPSHFPTCFNCWTGPKKEAYLAVKEMFDSVHDRLGIPH